VVFFVVHDPLVDALKVPRILSDGVKPWAKSTNRLINRLIPVRFTNLEPLLDQPSKVGDWLLLRSYHES
jgi:hypothetical protein